MTEIKLPPNVYTLYGPRFTIKSSAALTFPKPIVYYDLEHGAHRAYGWPALVASGDVIAPKINIPARSLTMRYQNLKGFKEGWRALCESVMEACENPFISTIVFDTGTKVRKLALDGFLQEEQEKKPSKKTLDPMEYGEPNRRMGDLLEAPMISGKDLVIIYHEDDKYEAIIDPMGNPVRDDTGKIKREPTGEKIPDGYKAALDLTDWAFHTGAVKVEGKSVPTAKVVKGGSAGFAVEGLELKWFSYAKLMQTLQMMGLV